MKRNLSSRLLAMGSSMLKSRHCPPTLSSAFSTSTGGMSTMPSPLICNGPNPMRMTARVLDGHAASKQLKEDITVEVSNMKSSMGVAPRLAMIACWDHEDEYVGNTESACESVGIQFSKVNLFSKAEIIDSISEYNRNPSVHGIAVQLPLIKYVVDDDILQSIDIHKDVGGRHHPMTNSQFAMGDAPLFLPYAQQGCIELLRHYDIDFKDRNVVVVSSNQDFGTVTSLMLRRECAKFVHFIKLEKFIRKADIILKTRQADIVLSAVGKANMIEASWIKHDAIVVDFGYNFIPDLKYPESDGHLLVGDVCYDDVSQVASAITPVQGGVGPMAIAMLLYNTMRAAKKMAKKTF